MSAILAVENLSAWYGAARILYDLAFEVGRGEVVALMGRNGAGKSTTMKAIMGLIGKRQGSLHFNGEDIARRSLDEMRRQGPVSDAQAQAWLAAMRAAFPDVKKGDRITGVHEPGVGARFFHNGEARPPVRDPVFAQRFFAIWLDARTSEPALREALLAPAR